MTFSLNTDPLFIFLMQTQPFTRSHFIILAPSKNLYLLDKTATKKKERKKAQKNSLRFTCQGFHLEPDINRPDQRFDQN